jgi:hypothetical protein
MKTKILLAAVVLMAGAVSYSFMAPQEPEVWDYMNIVQYDQYSKIAISGTKQDYSEIKLGHEKGYRTLLLKVREMEQKGWEISENSIDNAGNYFLLKKRKE